MNVMLAGAAAGVAMFLWGAVAHMALPIGEMGITPMPDDPAITSALKDKLSQPGLYMYPYDTDMAKFEALIRERPRGMLTYTPAGVPWSFGTSLGTQFAFDVLAGIALALLMRMVLPSLPSLGSRIAFAAAAGVIGLAWTLLAYWNWYSFPLAFVAGNTIEAGVACAIGGAIIGKLLR